MLSQEDDFDIPDMGDLQGAGHDAFIMNQRITSETFRYKFLNYNRAWLVSQLPAILTPRTLRRGRPYLVNQFTRILNQLNRDISSDSEGEEAGQAASTAKFGPVALSAKSRGIIRYWLAKAKKQLKLREAVQPLINQVCPTTDTPGSLASQQDEQCTCVQVSYDHVFLCVCPPQARGTHCVQCLSKHQLQVQLITPLADLASQWEREVSEALV